MKHSVVSCYVTNVFLIAGAETLFSCSVVSSSVSLNKLLFE